MPSIRLGKLQTDGWIPEDHVILGVTAANELRRQFAAALFSPRDFTSLVAVPHVRQGSVQIVVALVHFGHRKTDRVQILQEPTDGVGKGGEPVMPRLQDHWVFRVRETVQPGSIQMSYECTGAARVCQERFW